MPVSHLEIACGQVSETGRRPDNQDCLGLSLPGPGRRASHGIVAAVADGVGGSKGGRVAAELTIRDFIETYYALSSTIGVSRAAVRSIQGINRWVNAQGRSDPALENCATTFTALILRGRTAHVLHVGDSRAYKLSNCYLTCLTEDHTLNRGGLSHVLYRAVGIEPTVRLDHVVQSIQPGDRFLLCSDGVHGVLSDKRIQALLAQGAAPETVARAVAAAATAAGSSDNISALVIDVLAVPAIEHAELAQTLAELPSGAMPKVADNVDGFLLESELSNGRYSRLFKALDGDGKRAVVLKFPQPEAFEAEACRRAFLRESWVAGRVRSPWLGEVIELAPGRQTRLYSVMPYYRGETLEQRLSRTPPLTLVEGVTLAVRLAKAVASLHRAGIIHRDIKPDNVILTSDGGLRLIDLGVARLPRLEDSSETDSPGTPSFMAPELFSGQAADELSDLFALGVTVFRAFTGVYPYGEIEPFSRPRFGKALPLTTPRRDLPAWLDARIARAIALAPNERYGDVLEFALQLEQGLAGHASLQPRRLPIYQYRPERFWQGVSLFLALTLCAVLAVHI